MVSPWENHFYDLCSLSSLTRLPHHYFAYLTSYLIEIETTINTPLGVPWWNQLQTCTIILVFNFRCLKCYRSVSTDIILVAINIETIRARIIRTPAAGAWALPGHSTPTVINARIVKKAGRWLFAWMQSVFHGEIDSWICCSTPGEEFTARCHFSLLTWLFFRWRGSSPPAGRGL